MSHKFTSESLRKRIKLMKGMLSHSEPEHPSVQIGYWKSNDGTIESPVANGDKSPTDGKAVYANCPNGHTKTQSNGHTNGRAYGSPNGRLNGHTSDNNAPNIHRLDGSIKLGRRYEVVSRKRHVREDIITGESPKSVSFKGVDSPTESSDGKGSETDSGDTLIPDAASTTPRITSFETSSTFVDARTAFRVWPDAELSFQRQVIEKYETGSKLWTKEGLRDIEEKIASENPVKIPAFAGKDYVFEKELGVTYQVEFHGYQALAFPPSHRPNGMPYSSLSLKSMPFDYSESRSHEVELDVFHKCTALWLANPIGQHFYSMFMKLPLPPYINKIACFDLGSITAKPADTYPHIRQAIYRHAAALTIIECLHKRFGSKIRLYSQDTTYTSECVKVLHKKGFSIIGQHGAGGFAEIDDTTLVFAPNPSFCVKEVVADIAQPAAMFWNTVLSPQESEKATTSTLPLELDDRLTSHYYQPEADPDTPRVRGLIENYDRHPFPVTNLFGSVSLYTRSGMSVCHA
ncbi:hypothetical protein F4776DRAFT_673707 [Hypoxylon sp. NC0597]|nr:hypothetical protein F4776DRAFT_673707 [Hypoxylon sp. NC0597]